MNKEIIWINTNQALELFKKYEVEMTKTGLYYVGNQFGFMKKEKDNFHNKFNEKKLIKYIKEIIKPIPNGWISVLEAEKIFGISISFIYKLINDKIIKYKVLSRQRINYIFKPDMEEYMEISREGYILLTKVAKFYKCGNTTLLGIISSGKLKTKRFEGDKRLYVKREEIEKLFEHRETNKGKNNE